MDFTGTGDHWQRTQLYAGLGSAYPSIIETAPNQLAVYYDISGYGTHELTTGPNRLVYNVIDVVPVPEPTALAQFGSVSIPMLLGRRRSSTRV